MVGKGERLEVCFEIKGNGEVDGDILNKFHGVHFGDEIESDELPETAVEEPVAEETQATPEVKEDDSESASNDSEDKPKVTWREDVLLRVMDAHGIGADLRDSFVEHAVNFDLDDNGYLKKAELEEAAKAWNTENSSEDEKVEGDEPETPSEDSPSDETAEEKACPVCTTSCAADADTCPACGFSFIDM